MQRRAWKIRLLILRPHDFIVTGSRFTKVPGIRVGGTRYRYGNSADAKIIQKAVELNAAVVTFDSDFRSILANINGTLPSVVRIRIEGLKAPELAKLLHKTIQLAKQEILDGSAITITQNGIRVHRLPL